MDVRRSLERVSVSKPFLCFVFAHTLPSQELGRRLQLTWSLSPPPRCSYHIVLSSSDSSLGILTRSLVMIVTRIYHSAKFLSCYIQFAMTIASRYHEKVVQCVPIVSTRQKDFNERWIYYSRLDTRCQPLDGLNIRPLK